MKTYQEWLAEKHPEALEEGWGRNAMMAGALGLSTLFGGGGQAQAAQPAAPDNAPAVAQQSQMQKMQNMVKKNVIVKQGYLFARGFAKMQDQSPQSRINAERMAEQRAMVYAASYLHGSSDDGGTVRTQGHVPGTTIVTQKDKDGGIEVVIRTVEPIQQGQ